MRGLARSFAALAALAVAAVIGLPRVERWMLYPFDGTHEPPPALPRLGETTLQSGGGRLVVWTAPPRGDRPTILYFHGNAGNLSDRAPRFAWLLDQGYGLVAPGYRGSSGSTGQPDEAALTADALAVYDRLDRLVPGATPRRTVLYGESLGAAVALALTAETGRAQPCALVLEAPFTRLRDMARHLYPALAPVLPRLTNRWDSLDRIAALDAPLLVLHGARDELVPTSQGRRLHDAAPVTDKQFHAVPGAGHTDLWAGGPPAPFARFVEAHCMISR
jgi:hypothetical protein